MNQATHIEKVGRTTRRVGNIKGAIEFQDRGRGGRWVVVTINGSKTNYGVNKLQELFPTLNPRQILRHTIGT